MQVTRPSCNMRASSAGRSACQTPGDTRVVRRDRGGHQGPERGPEYEKHPSTPEGTGCGCGGRRSTGAAIQPLRPRRGSTAAKPGCRLDQRAMHAAFCGNPTGCRRVLGAVAVGWRSVPGFCPAGVANRQMNRYSNTLDPGSWLPTERTEAEERDLKNDRPKNYFSWTFAAHVTQIPPKKYNFTQFAAFLHFLFIKINYYFV